MAFVPVYILILFATIIIDYTAGLLIENAEGAKRKWFLAMSIVANVGILAFFKYYNFFTENVNHLLHISNAGTSLPLLHIILPIGLSFHTFQAMSYTIEVYRHNQKPERHFGIYALYVMFYPQLVAGPIERPQNILHQFHEKQEFDYDRVVSGLRQMMWGMIKKVVIADRLAQVADPAFNAPHNNISGVGFAIATVFFAFQIYCDFSGYTDIALGAARVMGFRLMVNFNNPYASKSISEFWKRWHISLSTWFYDYLFNPIVTGLRNWGQGAIVFGLLFTFFISGLWHGAAWHYIIWGLWHGTALSYEALTRKTRKRIFKKMPKVLGNAISLTCTFVYVCMGYVFFRAHHLRDAVFILKKIASVPGEFIHVLSTRKLSFLNLPGIYNVILPCFGLIVFLGVATQVYQRYLAGDLFRQKPAIVRWSLYFAALIGLMYFGVYEKHDFIYFQF